jgi:uncharacterized protein YgbK (DUF1537 family)
VVAYDLDTRAKPTRRAREVVRRAFSRRAARRASILYKKIDSTLRGHVAAELGAVRRALGRRAIVFSPAFPAQGRSLRDAALHLRGRPVSGDLRALLARAGLPATHLPEASPAALRAAVAAGARALVCDASTDADLDRIARAGLALRPRPLFVGSAGLARALARTLARRKAVRHSPAELRPVVTVVGSASPISRIQVRRLARARDRGPIHDIEWDHEPTRKDLPRVRELGRTAARGSRAHFVLTGGETARAVLSAKGIRALRLLGEVEPGVPFGMARDGTLVCTKAGAFGSPATLLRCVARLKKEMRR